MTRESRMLAGILLVVIPISDALAAAVYLFRWSGSAVSTRHDHGTGLSAWTAVNRRW